MFCYYDMNFKDLIKFFWYGYFDSENLFFCLVYSVVGRVVVMDLGLVV